MLVQSHEAGALTQWPLLCPQPMVNLNYFMMDGRAMKELETVQFGPGLRTFLGSHSEQGFPCSTNQRDPWLFPRWAVLFLAEDELLIPPI